MFGGDGMFTPDLITNIQFRNVNPHDFLTLQFNLYQLGPWSANDIFNFYLVSKNELIY
jgi:hypothetical protein